MEEGEGAGGGGASRKRRRRSREEKQEQEQSASAEKEAMMSFFWEMARCRNPQGSTAQVFLEANAAAAPAIRRSHMLTAPGPPAGR